MKENTEFMILPSEIKALKTRKIILSAVLVLSYVLGMFLIIMGMGQKNNKVLIAGIVLMFLGMFLMLPLSRSIVGARVKTSRWLERQVLESCMTVDSFNDREKVLAVQDKGRFLVPRSSQLVESEFYECTLNGIKIDICNWFIREKTRGGFLWLMETEDISFAGRLWCFRSDISFDGAVKIYTRFGKQEEISEVLQLFDDDVSFSEYKTRNKSFDEDFAVMFNGVGNIREILTDSFIDDLSRLGRSRGVLLCMDGRDVYLIAEHRDHDRKNDIKTEKDMIRIQQTAQEEIYPISDVISDFING